MSGSPSAESTAAPVAEPGPHLAAALALAALGWRLFPVGDGGKIPLVKDWPRVATADPVQLRAWWGERPASSIGIATGAASGLLVVDLDEKTGGPGAMKALEQQLGDLPPTVIACTGGGGYHLYFKHPGGHRKNSAGKVGPGIDTRGDGGYVVAPPSLHASGGRYEWAPGFAPGEVDLAPAPAWLLERLKATPKPTPAPAAPAVEAVAVPPGELAAALRRHAGENRELVDRVLRGEPFAPLGAHDDTLNRLMSTAAFALPDDTPDAAIIDLLRPSFTATGWLDGLEHLITEALKKLHRARERKAARDAQRIAESQAICERLGGTLADPAGDASGTVAAPDAADGPTWAAPLGYTVTHPETGQLGIYKSRGDSEPECIAPSPINVIGVGVDESGTKYAQVRWLDAGREHVELHPRAAVLGRDLIDLSARGAPVTEANRARLQTFLLAQEQDPRASVPSFAVFCQTGWARDFASFVAGNEPIGETGRVYMPSGGEFLDSLGAAGDPSTYLALCLELRDQGAVAEAFWAAGYAAALLRPLEMRSFSLSIWGPSGGGKSAVQALAASPWGRPSRLKHSGNISPAALEGELARFRDLPLWIDDTQLTREGLMIAYIVGAQVSSGRAKTDGSLRERKKWCGLATVSGERAMLREGEAAGAQNRTIEVRGQPIGDPALSARAHRELDRHYGHSGPVFVRALLDRYILPGRLHELREEHKSLTRELAGESPLSERLRYVALLVLADKLARVFVFAEDPTAAERAALCAGRALLTETAAADRQVSVSAEVALEAIVAFVASNPDRFKSFSVRERAGDLFERCPEADGKPVAAILPAALRELLKPLGIDPRQAVNDLADLGLIVRDGRNLGRKTKIGTQRPRAYWVILPELETLVQPAAPDAPAAPAAPDAPAAPTEGTR